MRKNQLKLHHDVLYRLATEYENNFHICKKTFYRLISFISAMAVFLLTAQCPQWLVDGWIMAGFVFGLVLCMLFSIYAINGEL